MKRKIIAIVLSIFLILIMPVTFLATGIFLPAQYEKTYYGQLQKMYAKLYETEGKKIIVLGNSAVAFGVDSKLMEQTLNDGGLAYKVCNFGLYGALGTKMMLDLSLDAVKEGDVIVFMPELIPQSMSLYFSAEHAWRALDQDQTMFTRLKKENQEQLIGSYTAYVAEKYKYSLEGGAQGSGVYASEVFDENGDMKNYARAQNIIQNACDVNNVFSFEESLLNEAFVDYVNEYYACVRDKGASMYFYCAPINELAVTEAGKANFDGFFQTLYEKFDFSLMGNPKDSIMPAEWFYDANVHLNEPGMTVYTALLTDAVKTKFGNTTLGGIELPPMPALPKPPQEGGEGDNTDVEFFLFDETEKGELAVVGLTELGKAEKSLVVPWSVNGKRVQVLSHSTFKNNDKIEEIVIQQNIARLENGSFDGCVSLKKIYLRHKDPAKLSIATELLLEDTPNGAFYVYEDVLPAFINNYFWGYYANSLKGYV